MRLKKIILKNIRSYEAEEIEFPSGSVLLSGDVGSGKTSILLAIEYALFGLQPGQTGSALLRNDSITGEVILELEIGGKEIIIERKLKRGKSVTNDYSAISINGEKIECSITELKTKILKLLNYPSEFIKKNNLLYRYTLYTPQEQMKQIILEEPEIRLNVLRHIFGMDKYKTIRENLSVLTNKIKEDSKIIQGEIKTLDSDKASLSLIKESLNAVEKKIKEKEISIAEKIKARKGIESGATELESKIKEGEKLEAELDKTKFLFTSKRESLLALNKDINEIEKEISELKETFKEEELLSLLKAIAGKKKFLDECHLKFIEIKSRINSFEQAKNDNAERAERVFKMHFCPTCLQNVPDSHKHNIINETENILSGLKKTLGSLEHEKLILFSELEKAKLEILELEDRKLYLEIRKSKTQDLEKSKKKIFDMKKSRENLDKDISLLSKHFDSLKESILAFSKYRNLYKLKQDELKKAFLEEKNEEISLAELKKEMELMHKEILALEESINLKEMQKKKLSDMLEIHDWLSSQFLSLINFTERNVMLRLRLEFSKLFSKWFYLLVQDLFEANLDENFTPVIMHNGAEMPYEFLSGGERTAVALAYRLALNQTINSLLSNIKTQDIVILDEPTEGFSEAQIEKMRNIFQELNVSQLIIVSHEQKIEGFVDSVIKIKKDKSSSAERVGAFQPLLASNQKT